MLFRASKIRAVPETANTSLSWRISKSEPELAQIRLESATSLEDLRALRGNRLEALSGTRKVFSIRINDQYRICFNWEEKGPGSVEITDYH
jgi:plasmid maintenance system killer protein